MAANPFTLDDVPSTPRRYGPSGPGWLTIFSANLAALLLAAAITGIVVRAYVRASIADSAEQFNKAIEKELNKPRK